MGYRDLPSRVIPPGVDTVAFSPNPSAAKEMKDRLGWSDGHTDRRVRGTVRSGEGAIDSRGCLGGDHDTVARAVCGWRSAGGRPEDICGGNPDRVQVVTGVTHAEVPGWMNAMSVLCAPSQTTARWREQFGRMLIEAMACGVPVIATDSGEIPHVIDDAGVLVPEQEPGTWTRAIERVLRDGSLRCELAQRGRARAEARFAWPVVARQHLEFFESLLTARARGV